MATVEDLAVEPEIDAVKENAQLHGWPFERVGPRCFRVTFTANNGDIYQVEVECGGFPVQPAAFHWRNPGTGQLDALADSPAQYGYFHDTGRICAPGTALLRRKAVLTLSGPGQTGCSSRKPEALSNWPRWSRDCTTSCAARTTGGVGSDK